MGRGYGPFMLRKPLDALEVADAIGSCRGWFFHPRRLPHGECGDWGSAPGFGGGGAIRTLVSVSNAALWAL